MFACSDPLVGCWWIAPPEWLAGDTAVQEGALLVMGGTFSLVRTFGNREYVEWCLLQSCPSKGVCRELVVIYVWAIPSHPSEVIQIKTLVAQYSLN